MKKEIQVNEKTKQANKKKMKKKKNPSKLTQRKM